MQKVCSKVCSGAYSKPDNGLTKYQWRQVIAHVFAALQDMGEVVVGLIQCQVIPLLYTLLYAFQLIK